MESKMLVAFANAIKEGRPYDFIGDNLREMNEYTIREIIYTLFDALSDADMDEISDTLYNDHIADAMNEN